MAKFNQGRFRPRNPTKYKGDPTNIIYRSGWELKLMNYLDKHPHVTLWNSEEIVVPYRSPIDGKMHRYFPDFYVEKIYQGKRQKVLIEVKPYSQTQPPTVQNTKKNKPTKRYLNEVKTWGTNSAKWNAAEEFCKDRGWQFQIITERELGIK